MPKFLHEYLEYRDGTIKDNGWWEIQGNTLVNHVGGRHDYVPSEDDEIQECEWSDILREQLIDNTQITGWIAPDGTFYGCATFAHKEVAEIVLGFSELDLERKGFIKIFELPSFMRIEYPKYGRYDYVGIREPTTKQKAILKEKGLEIRYWS